GAPIPPPPPGHQWAKIEHDNTKSWLATWKENVNGSIKYVFLAQNSSLKGQSDLKKFEKARELKVDISSKFKSRYFLVAIYNLKKKIFFGESNFELLTFFLPS